MRSETIASGPGGSITRQGERHFLFLQGLPGPFFRRLATALQAGGHRCTRVAFTGGDLLDWGRRDCVLFRDRADAWPAWLEQLINSRSITDIILFGDCRPLHSAAHDVARRLGVPVHVFEEGYLRPYWVTLEQGGVNGYSALPRSGAALAALDAAIALDERVVEVPNLFTRRARESIAHHTASAALSPLFRHFRSHRNTSAMRETYAWIRRWSRRMEEKAATQAGIERIGDAPFFLLPLQLDGDSQLTHHSPFAAMIDAVDAILASFAANAAASVRLLVKRHPLDPDVCGWRGLVEARAKALGIAERVIFIERGDLDAILMRASGVVTVNSTVGPLALRRAVPVLALGDAVYRIDGLTAGVPLDRFWSAPGSVSRARFDQFCRVLRATALVNGGFHSDEALDLLVRNASARLTGARHG